MNNQTRSAFLAVGIFAVAATILVLYRESVRIAKTEKPAALLTSVSDIKPGTYKFVSDLYGKNPNRDARSILFMRKSDGTLRAWYFPISDRSPAAPKEGDWFKPDKVCDPFAVDAEREIIECVVTEADRKVHLKWSWDGKGLGLFAPDMRPVPGAEEKGEFVFDVNSTYLTKEPNEAGK